MCYRAPPLCLRQRRTLGTGRRCYGLTRASPLRHSEMKPALTHVSLPPQSHLPTASSYALSQAVHLHPTPPPSAIAVDGAGYPAPYDHPYLHHPSNPVAGVHLTPEQQKIHTLFVSGLPDDVKPREIHNLFRRRAGFHSCQLEYTGRGDQVVAFVTFFNHQSALAAMNTLNGVIFDPQAGNKLHVELARSNSRTKRPGGVGVYTVIDKRVKVMDDKQETSSSDGNSGSDEPLGTDNDNSSDRGDLSTALSGEATGHMDGTRAKTKEHAEHSTGEISPCSTLFIANLGPSCTEEELKEVFSQYSGFQTLKMRGRGGMPVAFADFTDVESSTKAMEQLKDTLLPSSDRGSLHIEFARSKMRRG